MKTGIEIIADERQRQMDVEGWSLESDSRYTSEQLADAAASYALPFRWRTPIERVPVTWPWSNEWWKPTPENRIKELAKAGALISAEIDRIQRFNAYFTQMYDDLGEPIFVGDRLKSEWGYEVIVMKDEESNDYYGKLVCKPGHSCENIPYALNNGEGHTKIKN